MEGIVIIDSDSELVVYKDDLYQKVVKQIQKEIDRLILSQLLTPTYLSDICEYGFYSNLPIK